MKRIYIVLLVLISSVLFTAPELKAQERCPYLGPQLPGNLSSTTVGNFQITDTDGNTHDLYETLESGKTVFIDLFFVNCPYCQQYAPIIEQIYQDTGAGEGDIVMWGISSDPADTDPLIDQYKSNYGITNPCAGPQGGGVAAHNTIIAGQNFLGWPTYCVICADRSMFFDPVYPPTVTGFNTYFQQCADAVGIDVAEPLASNLFMVYPNPAYDDLYIDFSLERPSVATFELFDLSGHSILKMDYHLQAGPHKVSMDLSSFNRGYYFLKFSQNGVFSEIRRVIIL